MLDDDYLLRGLDALSRAHERSYFVDGHLGASVIAAYYLCHDNGLDARTQSAIKTHVDRDLLDDFLFRPAADEAPDDALVRKVLDALSAGAADLREVGHNVIFAAAALRVFRQLPQAVTPFRVNGLCALIASFETTQNVPVEEDDGVPEVADEDAFVDFIFREYLRTAARYSGRGQGWTGHLLTFGHALVELSRLGYQQTAASAHLAFRMYVATARAGPRETDEPRPEHARTGRTPLELDYWKARSSVRPGLGHAFKYAYSFYRLLSTLKDPVLRQRSLDESYRIF